MKGGRTFTLKAILPPTGGHSPIKKKQLIMREDCGSSLEEESKRTQGQRHTEGSIHPCSEGAALHFLGKGIKRISYSHRKGK